MREISIDLGVGALLAWCALPLLTRVAHRGAEEPASRQRVLTVALLLSSLVVAAPWLRRFSPEQSPLPLPSTLFASAAAATRLHPDPAVLASLGRGLLGAIGVGWLALVALSLAAAVVATMRLRGLCAQARPAPRWLSASARRVAQAAGVRAPRVLLSSTALVPFVVGVWRPRVVLPESLVASLDADALELALRHEVTHIARGDLAWAVALVIARLPFALHPTARWLGKEIALAREQAVDEIVGRARTRAYATLLVDVAEHVGTRRCPAALVSMEVSSLERRIARLAAPPAGRRGDLGRLVAFTALLLGVILFAPRSFAAAPAGNPARDASSTAAPPQPVDEAPPERCHTCALVDDCCPLLNCPATCDACSRR